MWSEDSNPMFGHIVPKCLWAFVCWLYPGCCSPAESVQPFFWCDAFKQLFLPGPEKPQDSQTHHSESTKSGALGFA